MLKIIISVAKSHKISLKTYCAYKIKQTLMQFLSDKFWINNSLILSSSFNSIKNKFSFLPQKNISKFKSQKNSHINHKKKIVKTRKFSKQTNRKKVFKFSSCFAIIFELFIFRSSKNIHKLISWRYPRKERTKSTKKDAKKDFFLFLIHTCFISIQIPSQMDIIE